MSPAFQPANVEALCSCILTTAQDTPTFQLSQHTAAIANTIKPDTIQRLGKCLLLIHGQVVNFFSIDDAIKKFFATLDSTFIKRTVKMHLLEDHMVEWITTHQAGWGLTGEQGAESIHAKLLNTHSGIRNPTAKLKSIMN